MMTLQSFALADPAARPDQPAPATISRSEDEKRGLLAAAASRFSHRVREVENIFPPRA